MDRKSTGRRHQLSASYVVQTSFVFNISISQLFVTRGRGLKCPFFVQLPLTLSTPQPDISVNFISHIPDEPIYWSGHSSDVVKVEILRPTPRPRPQPSRPRPRPQPTGPRPRPQPSRPRPRPQPSRLRPQPSRPRPRPQPSRPRPQPSRPRPRPQPSRPRPRPQPSRPRPGPSRQGQDHRSRGRGPGIHIYGQSNRYAVLTA